MMNKTSAVTRALFWIYKWVCVVFRMYQKLTESACFVCCSYVDVDAFFSLFIQQNILIQWMKHRFFFHTYKVTHSQTKWEKKNPVLLHSAYSPHTNCLGNVCFYCYSINSAYNLTVYWSLLMQNMVHSFFLFSRFCFVFLFLFLQMHGVDLGVKLSTKRPKLLNDQQDI